MIKLDIFKIFKQKYKPACFFIENSKSFFMQNNFANIKRNLNIEVNLFVNRNENSISINTIYCYSFQTYHATIFLILLITSVFWCFQCNLTNSIGFGSNPYKAHPLLVKGSTLPAIETTHKKAHFLWESQAKSDLNVK